MEESLTTTPEVKMDSLVLRERKAGDLFPDLVLNPEAYQSVILTEKESQKVRLYLRLLTHGASAQVPLICLGERCPFKSACPSWELEELAKSDREAQEILPKLPIGKPCPYEFALLRQQAEDYGASLQVSPDDYVEKRLCLTLAEFEVLEYRINILMRDAEAATMVEEQPVGWDKEAGEIVYRKEISKWIELKFRIQGMKQKLLDLMTGTPRSKWQKAAALHGALGSDASRRIINLKAQITKQREQPTNQTQEATILSADSI